MNKLIWKGGYGFDNAWSGSHARFSLVRITVDKAATPFDAYLRSSMIAQQHADRAAGMCRIVDRRGWWSGADNSANEYSGTRAECKAWAESRA